MLYKAIPLRENYLFFFTNSFKIIKGNSIFRSLADSLYSEHKLDDDIILKKFNIDVEKLNTFKNNFEKMNIFNESVTKKNYRNHVEVKIHTASSCNLSCGYCYASETNKENLLMTENTMEKSIVYLEKKYSNSDISITFFGGEPLLNFNAIRFCCDFIDTRKNLFKNKYTFNIITNLTILNDEIIDCFNTYNFSIRVSLDGPKKIHDILRLYPNGQGSFDKVYKNLKYLIDKIWKKNKINYESTYTKQHQDLGITRKNLKKYLKDNFGFNSSLIVDVSDPIEHAPEKDEVNKKKDSNNDRNRILEYLEDEEFHSTFYRFLKKIKNNYVCSIGKTYLAIASNGDIYPCHKFLDYKKKFKIGNVLNDFSNAIDTAEKSKIDLLNHNKNPKCKLCWAKYLCKSCPADLFIRTGDIVYNDEECERLKISIEKKLKIYYSITIDEDLRSNFINKIGEDSCDL